MLTIKGWKARTKSGDTATLLHSALQARTSAGQNLILRRNLILGSFKPLR